MLRLTLQNYGTFSKLSIISVKKYGKVINKKNILEIKVFQNIF